MEIHKTLKNIIAGLGLLILVALIISLIAYQANKSKVKDEPEKVLQVDKQEIPADKIPDKLPANIPIEKNAKVRDNYSASTNDGRTEATRSYETSKSLEENLSIFTEFMKSNGWTITSTTDQEKYKAVSGVKGSSSLLVQMNTDVGTDAKTVSIALTEFPNQ